MFYALKILSLSLKYWYCIQQWRVQASRVQPHALDLTMDSSTTVNHDHL